MSATETELEICSVDTNIWLYAFIEGDNRQKSPRAKLLIEASRDIVISVQVINEVCVNLIKSAQFSEQQVQQLIESFYAKNLVVELNKPLLLKAWALQEQYAFSFWDSTIVASALYAYASVLYSEAMQDGLSIENRMRVINPFKGLQQSSAESEGISAQYYSCIFARKY
jgi:predicted nucleic acid-binding protein